MKLFWVVCRFCGTEFQTALVRVRYCSKKCRRKVAKERLLYDKGRTVGKD